MRILVLLLFLSLSLLGKAQTRRALVIGLGQQEDKAWGKINGDKDVSYVLRTYLSLFPLLWHTKSIRRSKLTSSNLSLHASLTLSAQS